MAAVRGFKLALVSGDGLPVSGLLTVFRNVVALGRELGLLDTPIPADLGYSWRPDKPAFYPSGAASVGYPDWLSVTDATPVADTAWLANELTEIRHAVAFADRLDPAERDELRRRIAALSDPYERYFTDWFKTHDVDWVCAVNMTLSDAVPVTLGLHRAAARRWNGDRPGGVLFWDHDLLASYSVHEAGVRVYPLAPNTFTPVPGGSSAHRWAVVSEGLAKEAAGYPTSLSPELVPNILPGLPDRELRERHHEFLAEQGLEPGRPIILVPVRVFRVKGVEIAVSLLAAVRAACVRLGCPSPYLLVFGSLGEDPEYSQEVLAAVCHEGVGDDIRFLDGVPLSTYRDSGGRWWLDEVDLLRIAAATHGGLFFTPNRPDVESVGLGPALAALAGIPCATTSYQVLDDIYGMSFSQVRVPRSGDLTAAGAEFAQLLMATRRDDPSVRTALAANQAAVRRRFPTGPWQTLLEEMAVSAQRPAQRPVQRKEPSMTTELTVAADLTEVVIPPAQQAGLRELVAELASRYGRADHGDFLRNLGGLAHRLPEELRERLQQLRYLDSSAALVIRNGPVDADPGPTPAHWRERGRDCSLWQDMWLTLVAGQLGDPICWKSLQDGRLLNDILPVAGEEEAQTGHGSEAELEFHVEDAFHDDRCDVLALLCLRNVDHVPTTVASVASLDLAALDLDVLFEPRFLVLPDPEHLRTAGTSADAAGRVRPVLYGQKESPYLRVDPAYTEPLPGDAAAAAAFAALCRQLADRLVDVALEPGDLLLVDNHRAVHGRRPFQARYDGTDRWLRKVTVTRNLRTSRGRRSSADSRALNPFD